MQCSYSTFRRGQYNQRSIPRKQENGITDVDGLGNNIKNCSIQASPHALILFDCFDNIVSNFFIGPVETKTDLPSSGANVFRNNTFLHSSALFSGGDVYLGNAFLNGASHTGGTDIAGHVSIYSAELMS